MDRVRQLKCRPGRASQRQGKGQLGWAWKSRLGHCELPGVGSVTCPITSSYTGARVWSFTMQHCCWVLLSFSSPSSNERGSASEYSFRKRETRVHVQVSPRGACIPCPYRELCSGQEHSTSTEFHGAPTGAPIGLSLRSGFHLAYAGT